MTEELKNRKVKAIKLNPEKEVRFYDEYGRSHIVTNLYSYEYNHGDYYEYQNADYTGTMDIVRNNFLTDYGISELEQGNIIVEFEGEENVESIYLKNAKTFADKFGTSTKDMFEGEEVKNIVNKMGRKGSFIEIVDEVWTPGQGIHISDPRINWFNAEGEEVKESHPIFSENRGKNEMTPHFKTELPSLIDYFISESEKYATSKTIIDNNKDICIKLNQLLQALHEQDERILKLETKLDNLIKSLNSKLVFERAFGKRVDEIETQLKELGERKSDE